MTTSAKKKLGIALVGLGTYSSDQLGPALKQTINCYLAGIVTDESSKENEWKDKYNIPEKNIYNYENFDSIYDNSDIDIIYIVLPVSMHKKFTIRAAKAEKGWFELTAAYRYKDMAGFTIDGPMNFDPNVNQQARQMDDFATCILENKHSRVSGDEGLKDMKVIEAVYKSIASGEKRTRLVRLFCIMKF